MLTELMAPSLAFSALIFLGWEKRKNKIEFYLTTKKNQAHTRTQNVNLDIDSSAKSVCNFLPDVKCV